MSQQFDAGLTNLTLVVDYTRARPSKLSLRATGDVHQLRIVLELRQAFGIGVEL
jgi:hypothetical protein